MDIDPGTVVANRYRISRPLGRGGMGEVFAAENIRTGRPVAVKLLRADSKAKSSAVARFRQEARAAGSINSDHVTQVLDVEEDSEHGVVLVFELLEGESLIDRLKRTGPIPFDELHAIIEQVWLGLADAHRVGIIHRDLKPSNVFLERRPDGTTRVKILDFGISKLPKEMGGETLTEMGQSLGTFSFMPPEQIGKAKMVDHRADIYACATLVYQSLTGQLPYMARNILVMVEQKQKTDARKLSDALAAPIDPRLEAFVAQGLARDAGKRFQTAVEALAAWRDLRPGQRAAPPQEPAAPQRQEPAPQRSRTPQPRQAILAPQQPAPADADTAATLAIPAPHFAEQAAPEPPPRIDPHISASVGPRSQGAPPSGLGLGGTQPVRMIRPVTPVSPSAQVANAARSSGINMSVPTLPSDKPASERGAGQGHQAPQSTGQPPSSGSATAAPVSEAVPSPAPMRGTPPSAVAGVSRVIDDPTSIPNSSEGATQVYRPRGAEALRLAPPVPGPGSASSALGAPPRAKPKRSSPWTFLIGAFAFLLVGFVIVAAIMRYKDLLPSLH